MRISGFPDESWRPPTIGPQSQHSPTVGRGSLPLFNLKAEDTFIALTEPNVGIDRQRPTQAGDFELPKPRSWSISMNCSNYILYYMFITGSASDACWLQICALSTTSRMALRYMQLQTARLWMVMRGPSDAWLIFGGGILYTNMQCECGLLSQQQLTGSRRPP